MNVMKRAWQIARLAEVEFGGKAVEYITGALKMAWAEYKQANAPKTEIEIPGDTRRQKTWVAAIIGSHPTYKLDRKFVNSYEVDKFGDKVYRLENGLYELQNHKQRMFIEVSNGTYTIVEKSFVMERVA